MGESFIAPATVTVVAAMRPASAEVHAATALSRGGDARYCLIGCGQINNDICLIYRSLMDAAVAPVDSRASMSLAPADPQAILVFLSSHSTARLGICSVYFGGNQNSLVPAKRPAAFRRPRMIWLI